MEGSDRSIYRLHVVIGGEVQGVGFRYATQRQALASGLNGWVRNRADGRVEAVFEGSKGDLERMLDWCKRGPVYAQVSQVESGWECGAPTYTDFRIRS